MGRLTPAAALLFALAVRSPAVRANAFDPKTASFAVAYHEITTAYRDAAVFVTPGEQLAIRAVNGPAGDYRVATDAGIVEPRDARTWRWTAPDQPGTYAVKIGGPATNRDTVTLHAFVVVPLADARNGWLRGYRVGVYPPPLNGHATYRPPRGLVEVTRHNERTKVSPHFELKQFVCKEDPPDLYPKFLIVDERLPLELEAILERVDGLGFDVDTLHVMSGYRTPYYNHAIGDVKYSMHQFGAAADIYVDPGGHDRMADLNGDRRVDVGDAKFLYDRIEELLAEPAYRHLHGGMGFYPATQAHPPFVHVDVRGARARWRG